MLTTPRNTQTINIKSTINTITTLIITKTSTITILNSG